MEKQQNTWSIPLIIIAVIVGSALYRQFDYATFRFKNVGLGIVYLITFVAAVVFLVRGRRSKEQ